MSTNVKTDAVVVRAVKVEGKTYVELAALLRWLDTIGGSPDVEATRDLVQKVLTRAAIDR